MTSAPLGTVTFRDVPDHLHHARAVHIDGQLLGHLWRVGRQWSWAHVTELEAGQGFASSETVASRREDTIDVAAYRLIKTATGATWREVRDAIAVAVEPRAA